MSKKTEAQIEAEIQKMRDKDFGKRHAGMRFEDPGKHGKVVEYDKDGNRSERRK